MNRLASVLSALILLCTFARAQTQVIPAPLGGHIPIMSVDAAGQQHILAPSYKLSLDPVADSTTCVTISFWQNDTPHLGYENRMQEPASIAASAGISWQFTWRRWLARAPYEGHGYWAENGLWINHDDLPHDANGNAINASWVSGTGCSIQYPWSANLGASDGVLDWSGPGGTYWYDSPCQTWINMTIDDPFQIARLKSSFADENGKVHFCLTPRAILGAWGPGHFYPPTPENDGSWAYACNYVTNIGFILVDAE